MKPMVRVYADGGKVVDREYGTPTFGKSLAAKAGVGDGYSYMPKKASKAKDPNAGKRMSIANASAKLPEAVAKRKKELDDA